MPILNSCCFRVPLDKGALILGSLGLAGSGVSVLNMLLLENRTIVQTLEIPFLIIFFFCAVCLVLSSHFKNEKLVIPWLVGQTGFIVLSCGYMGYLAYNNKYWPLYVTCIIVVFLFGLYFLLCVAAYYQQLKALSTTSVIS